MEINVIKQSRFSVRMKCYQVKSVRISSLLKLRLSESLGVGCNQSSLAKVAVDPVVLIDNTLAITMGPLLTMACNCKGHNQQSLCNRNGIINYPPCKQQGT